MSGRKISFQLILFSSLILLIIADHKNILRLTKIQCMIGDKAKGVVVNTSCEIKALSRTRSAVNLDTYLLKPFNDIFINGQVFKKNSVRYLPFMVNVTLNVCKFLDGTDKSSFYVKFVYGWINKYSNINHSCPFLGHLFARNLEPFADKIPVFVPAGDYRLDINFFQSSLKNWIGVLKGYATITLRPYIQQEN